MLYALQLGSDCPFFILNRPCFASGRGEEFDKIDIDLEGFILLLVNPEIMISTAEAFSCIEPAVPEASLKEIISSPVHFWRNKLKNDFEISVFKKYPEIGTIKDQMYDSGALYASMTGTGSTVFGLYKDPPPLSVWKDNFIVKTLALTNSFSKGF